MHVGGTYALRERSEPYGQKTCRVGPRQLLDSTTQGGIECIVRDVMHWNETYALREPREAYRSEFAGETGMLRLENTILWAKSAEPSET